jgi:hypothetical protein
MKNRKSTTLKGKNKVMLNQIVAGKFIATPEQLKAETIRALQCSPQSKEVRRSLGADFPNVFVFRPALRKTNARIGLVLPKSKVARAMLLRMLEKLAEPILPVLYRAEA